MINLGLSDEEEWHGGSPDGDDYDGFDDGVVHECWAHQAKLQDIVNTFGETACAPLLGGRTPQQLLVKFWRTEEEELQEVRDSMEEMRHAGRISAEHEAILALIVDDVIPTVLAHKAATAAAGAAPAAADMTEAEAEAEVAAAAHASHVADRAAGPVETPAMPGANLVGVRTVEEYKTAAAATVQRWRAAVADGSTVTIGRAEPAVVGAGPQMATLDGLLRVTADNPRRPQRVAEGRSHVCVLLADTATLAART